MISRSKILATLTLSTASILAQMKTKIGCNSLNLLANNLRTYGKIPTDRACMMRQTSIELSRDLQI